MTPNPTVDPASGHGGRVASPQRRQFFQTMATMGRSLAILAMGATSAAVLDVLEPSTGLGWKSSTTLAKDPGRGFYPGGSLSISHDRGWVIPEGTSIDSHNVWTYDSTSAGSFLHRLDPPGSMMKLLLAAVMVEHGVPWIHTPYDCRQTTSVEGVPVHCEVAHGPVDLSRAISLSCNGYFAHGASYLRGEWVKAVAALLWPELTSPKAYHPWADDALWDWDAVSPKQRLDRILGQDKDLSLRPVDVLRWADKVWGGGSKRFAQSLSSPVVVPTLRHATAMGATYGTAAAFHPLEQSRKVQIWAKTGTILHPGISRGTGESALSVSPDRFSSWVMGAVTPQPDNEVRQPALFCAWSDRGTSRDAAVPTAITCLQHYWREHR